MNQKIKDFWKCHKIKIEILIIIIAVSLPFDIYVYSTMTACNKIKIGDVYTNGFTDGNPFYIKDTYEVLDKKGDFVKFKKNGDDKNLGTCRCSELVVYSIKLSEGK